ncbi:MAG: hypothetical protein ABSE16_14610, partial [Verrucomicrobiota bacterium]
MSGAPGPEPATPSNHLGRGFSSRRRRGSFVAANFLILSILLILSNCLGASVAVIPITDDFGNPLTNQECVITDFSIPYSRNAGVAIQWRGTATTDVTGTLWLTNLAPGKIQISAVGQNYSEFTFYMPVTNGTINAQYWLTTGEGNTIPPDTMSYGVNASDMRFLHVWDAAAAAYLQPGFGLLAGTNVNNSFPTWSVDTNNSVAGLAALWMYGAGATNYANVIGMNLTNAIAATNAANVAAATARENALGGNVTNAIAATNSATLTTVGANMITTSNGVVAQVNSVGGNVTNAIASTNSATLATVGLNMITTSNGIESQIGGSGYATVGQVNTV